MSKRMLVVVAVPAALLALAGSAFGHSTKAKTLHGVVGPSFSISLKLNGMAVKTLRAGSYTFVVADRSTFHGFTLEKEKGGTFEKDLTSVPSTGTKTVTVKLTKGKWKFYCPPHESQMFGFFTVT